jgi:dihydrolipoamide dehydrogenase
MYDLIVLGGGPAGGNAAERAAGKGLKTLLVEERFLGGVCLNEGCIPSKALLHCAKLYQHAKSSAAFGVTAHDVRFDLGVAMERKNKLVAKIRKASENSKKRGKVDVAFARGEIAGRQAEGFRLTAGEQSYEGRRLLLTTGSEAIRIPIPGADQPFVMTNREILDIDHVPRRLAIIGGGVIGLEFATFFSEIGVEVTVIEMLPAIAGALDDEIRGILQKTLEKKGVTFKLKARVTEIGDKRVMYETEDGARESLEADVVLMSVGRRPRTSGIGLETIGVECDAHAVKVDAQGRTSVQNVFAAGDINGRSMLAHTASREAEVCVDAMLGKRCVMRYDAIPNVIYTHPEVASTGLTKKEALARGYDAIVGNLPLAFSGRYLAETEHGRGVVKAVIDKDYGTILGVHMIGGECSEMIPVACAMVEAELRVRDVEDIVFPHPTVVETMKDAIVSVDILEDVC